MAEEATKEEKRASALACAGERFLTHIYKGSFNLKLIHSLPELFEMWEEATNGGRSGSAESIRAEIESRLPWAPKCDRRPVVPCWH